MMSKLRLGLRMMVGGGLPSLLPLPPLPSLSQWLLLPLPLSLSLLSILAISSPARAQVSNPAIIAVTSAPSGSCNQTFPDQQVVYLGTVYTCQQGTWAELAGGGGGSLPAATAIGQTLAATAAGTTYQAINISHVPVEFYGATPYSSEAAAEAGPDDTAKFQAAVDSGLGIVTCQSGKWYHVDGPVNFAAYTGLEGTANQTYGGTCSIVSNSATNNILTAIGTSTAYMPGVTVKNLTIDRSVTPTGTASGIYASFTGGMIVENVLSNDSIYDFYRHASPGFATGYWTHNQAGWLLGETSGTYYGFYDDSADGNAEDSIILTHSGVACQNLGSGTTSYGQILSGHAVNDNDTWDFNTAGCSYGQVVNYVASGSPTDFACSDIHWRGSTNDNFRQSAFEVLNCPASNTASVEIDGGWGYGASPAPGPVVAITNSSGVSVTHAILGTHATEVGPDYNITVSGGSGNTIANNTLLNTTYAVNLDNNTSGNTVVGNTISNAGSSALSFAIQANQNATGNVIADNTISGLWNTGLYLDSSTSNNNDLGNVCGSGVGTCLNDAGTNGVNSLKVLTPTATSTPFMLGAPKTEGSVIWNYNSANPFESFLGIYDTGNAVYYGLSPGLAPGQTSVVELGGYYKGIGVQGASSNTNTPIFGILNNSQSGSGLGSTELTIYDNNKVDTFNNTLDDGAGNFKASGSVTTPSVTVNSDSPFTAAPRAFLPFATGQLAAIVTSGQYFVGQLAKAGTVENFTATAATFACTTNPTITLEDCGASAGTCSSPTALASVTLTAANTVTAGTITSATLTAGHYFVMETTAGVCTALNVSGSAEYRMN